MKCLPHPHVDLPMDLNGNLLFELILADEVSDLLADLPHPL